MSSSSAGLQVYSAVCTHELVTRLETKVMKTFLCLSQTFKMLKTPDVLVLLCLVGAVNALYKQWIPDTNYENKTNWDKGDVPCGSDTVQFPARRKVSVFVETRHAVREMRLPVDGELILNPGAGFYVVSGQDPDCGAGVTTQFKDSEPLQWFDPSLWQAAATRDDLQRGDFLFSVHEEGIPCKYDDVVFKDLSSFRVDTSSSQPSLPVKSVSVLGKVFTRKSEFSQYLSSHSGHLQFQGSTPITVGNPGCGDPSGCDCGNREYHDQICGTTTCGSVNCKEPVLPVGHCCEVCGAIVAIHYTTGFNLQTYRERIRHLFLGQPQYKSTQLGMSKVLKSQRLLGIIPFGASADIQVVILDGETGARAMALAGDIVNDARSQGPNLGITGAEIQASSHQPAGKAGMVAGVVVGVLVIIALAVTMVVLIRKGVVRMPPMPRLKRNSDIGELGGTLDQGFENPMFDTPHMMPDILECEPNNSIAMTPTGVYFINPVYDDKESDFNA